LRIQHDVLQLQALGKILGEDGRAFFELGEDADRLLVLGYKTTTEGAQIAELVDLYERISKSDRSDRKSTFQYPSPHLQRTADQIARDVVDEEYGAWYIDFLDMPEAKPKRKCAFCGVVSIREKQLHACGRCKTTLYCDTKCQKMDWKKGHKAGCREKSKEKPEEKAEEEPEETGETA
jgi:hypothetical protein